MTTDRKFNVFEEWKHACEGVGLNGPVGVQGHNNWQYLSADGTVAAAWNGSTDVGVIHVDVPDELVNVPEEPPVDG